MCSSKASTHETSLSWEKQAGNEGIAVVSKQNQNLREPQGKLLPWAATHRSQCRQVQEQVWEQPLLHTSGYLYSNLSSRYFYKFMLQLSHFHPLAYAAEGKDLGRC